MTVRMKIQKETTNQGSIVFTYCNDDHAEGMWFKNEEEFQLFVSHLNMLVECGACAIEIST